jgi:hypothetical protein
VCVSIHDAPLFDSLEWMVVIGNPNRVPALQLSAGPAANPIRCCCHRSRCGAPVPAPGARVADLWPSIVDYMNDHSDRHPQLHFVSEAALQDTIVQGSVYADGNNIDAFIQFSTGTN